jgi:hypothetical protein
VTAHVHIPTEWIELAKKETDKRRLSPTYQRRWDTPNTEVKGFLGEMATRQHLSLDPLAFRENYDEPDHGDIPELRIDVRTVAYNPRYGTNVLENIGQTDCAFRHGRGTWDLMFVTIAPDLTDATIWGCIPYNVTVSENYHVNTRVPSPAREIPIADLRDRCTA